MKITHMIWAASYKIYCKPNLVRFDKKESNVRPLRSLIIIILHFVENENGLNYNIFPQNEFNLMPLIGKNQLQSKFIEKNCQKKKKGKKKKKEKDENET